MLPLLIFFIAKQVLLVAIIGPFSGHDEVDHFYYIQRLSHGDGLGVVGEVSLPAEAAPYERYVADFPLNSEVIQPPLYHAPLALIANLFPTTLSALYALRFVSIALGVVVIWFGYRIAARLFPAEPLLFIGTPLVVALQPQFAFVAAIVNHDVLVIALATLVFWLLIRSRTTGGRDAALLGLSVGAGIWTKTSFGLMLPVVALAVTMGAWTARPRSWTREAARDWLAVWLPRGTLATGLPLLLAAPWLWRNWRLYGDPTAAARLREVSDYGDSASTLSEMITSPVFWRGRLEDTWGNYGWRQIPWDVPVYHLTWWAWAVCLVGLLTLAARLIHDRFRRRSTILDVTQMRGLLLAFVMLSSMMIGVLYVGTIQFTQTRFAFPAIVPVALLSMLGLAALIPQRFRGIGLVIVVTLLIMINVVVTVRFVMPYYAGETGGAIIFPQPLETDWQP